MKASLVALPWMMAMMPLGVMLGSGRAARYMSLTLVVLMFTAGFAHLLLRAPDYYPAIDQRHFFALAGIARDFLTGKAGSWPPFRETLPSQYNALFAVPIVPFLLIFGSSFYVYGMAIALLYGTGAALAAGGVAASLLDSESGRLVFPSVAATALVAITRSAAWFSTRNYYPDVGDALVLALWLIAALWLVRKPDWRRTGLVVVLSLAVILFRRHLLFAWGASGLGLAVAASIGAWSNRHLAGRVSPWRSGVTALAASAILTLGLLYLLAPSFLREMASIAAADAYADYERRPYDVARAIFGVMGLVPAVLAAAGYVAAAWAFPRHRRDIAGIGLGCCLHLLCWILVLRQIGPQYYVVPGALFLPIGIGLGVAALAKTLRDAPAWMRATAFGLLVSMLTLSAGRLVQAAAHGSEPPIAPAALQARIAPLAWHAGMAEPLRRVFARIGDPNQPVSIFVVASSIRLNEAIAQSAAEALLGEQRAAAYVFPWVPAIDTRDRLPVSEVLQADFVLIADPPQSHLPTGFEGLRRVHDMFASGDPAARDFAPVGPAIAFPGYAVTVYRRIRASDEHTALAMLDALREAVPRRGFTQPSWIEIGNASRTGKVEVWANDAVIAHDRDAGQGWPAAFLSYDREAGDVALRGEAQTDCPDGVTLAMGAVPPADSLESEDPVFAATTIQTTDRTTSQRPFLLKLALGASPVHLALRIKPLAAIGRCNVTLRHLALAAGGS